MSAALARPALAALVHSVHQLRRRCNTRGFTPARRGTFVSAKVPKAICPGLCAGFAGSLAQRLPQKVLRQGILALTSNAQPPCLRPFGLTLRLRASLGLSKGARKANLPIDWGVKEGRSSQLTVHASRITKLACFKGQEKQSSTTRLIQLVGKGWGGV